MKKLLDLLSIGYRKALISGLLVGLLILPIFPGLVSAADCPIQPQTGTCAPGTSGTTNTACNNGNSAQCLQSNPIVKDINQIVNFLSAGVGIIVVAVLIIGGFQYMAAGDNPQGLTNAKKRIANGLIALLAFIFMFAFLQWLIPGGVFN